MKLVIITEDKLVHTVLDNIEMYRFSMALVREYIAREVERVIRENNISRPAEE